MDAVKDKVYKSYKSTVKPITEDSKNNNTAKIEISCYHWPLVAEM